MPSPTPIERQVEKILDLHSEDEIEVIVQMEQGQDRPGRLERAASEALSRRRFSLSPRDLLPNPYKAPIPRQVKQETASTRTLLGKSAQETLARNKELGEETLHPLLQNGIVRAAVARMSTPKRKSARPAEILNQFWTSRSVALRLERDELAQLPQEVANIRAIHPNRRLCTPAVKETRQLSWETQEVLVSTWGLRRCQILSAWGAYGARGEGVTIGLLDTGVDPSHPDLAGKVAHWAEFDSLGTLLTGDKPYDSDEHGTHCAGTLVGGNAKGRHIGVAPDAKLAVGLVLNGQEGGTDAQILAGIDWAVEKKVGVLSLSLGGLSMEYETAPTYSKALLSCVEAGIPVVVAIGNEGQQTTGSPGNDLFALSVGATDVQDRVAAFSGGRTQIIRESDYIDPEFLPLPYSKPDLSAPGVAIYSAVPEGGYKALSGTSMAAPHVAGAIALLLSATSIREKETGAHRTYLIQDLITGAVEDLGEVGQDHRYGFGRLDVMRAIDFAWERGYQREGK